MTRKVPKAVKRGKAPESGHPRKRAHREARPTKSIASTTTTGATKQTLAPKHSQPVASRSDVTTRGRKKAASVRRRAVTETPVARFDAIKVAECVEACRAHVASLTRLARISSRTLFECYEFEGDEPQLWQCCGLVREVLKQVHAALIPLGVVSHETGPHVRAEEIAIGCEVQRQWLRPAVHVIRATIHVLLDIKSDLHDEVLPALRDLEGGLSSVVTELQYVIWCCPCRTGRGAA